MHLPDYDPPAPRRAVAACAGSPLIVLAVFVLLVIRWFDLELAAAWLLGATVWVAWEMHDYQRTLDAYNARYAREHLDGRPLPALRALADDVALGEATRDFVRRYLADGGQLRRDGPSF